MRKTLVLAVVLVASACGSGNTGGGAPPPPNVATGTQDINPKPYEQVQDGGELKWPVQDFPASFNELSGDASSSDIPPITRSVMPTPSVEQPDATFKPNPEYLTSMELVSKEPEKVTYKLNQKAHWSDGSPITWEDYRSQWQALNGRNHDFVVLSTAGYENIADISRGADDYEFTVTYNPKYGDWGAVFQVLYPKSMTSDPAAFNKGWADGPKLTGGPFKIGEVNQTSKTVIVVRDDTWWGKKAKLDRIIFRNISTSGGIPSIDALANGGLDFASIAGNLDAYKRAQSIQGVVFRRATLPNLRWILFNGSGSSPLADPEVRKAVARGVDVASITKAEVSQLIPDAKPLGNHIFVEGFPGYQDNSAGYGFDPEAAKKRLDELGWKLDGQFRKKDGRSLTIRDVVPADNKASDEEAVLVQHQLAAIGVEVKVDQVDNAGFFDKQLGPGNFEVTHFAQMEANSMINIVSSYSLGANVSQNFGKIGNDKVNKLIQDAAQELDVDKRRAILNDLDKELWNLGYALPLYRRPSIVAAREKLANFGNAGLATPDYTMIGWVK